jgi:hypothetical protein
MTSKKNNAVRTGLRTSAIVVLMLLISTCDILTPGLGDSVDINAPTVVLESHRNGDYVGGSTTLSGTIEDDTGATSVVVSVDGSDYAATLGGSGWSATVDTSTLTDGDHEFTITATDTSAKRSNLRVLLTVDNNPPTVLVNVPEDYSGSSFNKVITIKGEASDTTRVSDVQLSLFEVGSDTEIFSGESATGTTSWYFSFDAGPGGYDLDGDYYLIVNAFDNSGNTNQWFYHFSDLLANASDPSDIPNIEEINAYEFQGQALPGSLTVALDTLRLSNAANQMAMNIDPNSDDPYFEFTTPSISGGDSFASPQRFSGFVEDDDGLVSAVEISVYEAEAGYLDSNPVLLDSDGDSIGDATWVSYGLSINGTQWTYEADLPTGQAYYLRIRAEDRTRPGTWIYSDPVDFGVPEGIPGIVVLSPQQGTYVGNDSVIDFEVAVSNLNSGNIEIDLTPGDGDWSDALPVSNFDRVEPEGDVYTISIDAASDFTLANGSASFKLRAGIPGAYGQTTWQYVGDVDPPNISVTFPSEYLLPEDAVNGTIPVSGISDDGLNPLEGIYLKFESGSVAAEVSPDFAAPGWFSPVGLANWTAAGIDTTDGGTFPSQPGDYSLHYFARDAAGNISIPAVLHFRVDQSSDLPVFSFSNVLEAGTAADNILSNGSSIFAQVSDDDSIDVGTLEVRIDIGNDGLYPGIDLNSDTDTADVNESETWVDVSSKPGSNSAVVNFSHTLSLLPQGIHAAEFRVDDINGVSQSIGPILFTLDFGPPSIVITSPTPLNGSVQNADFDIAGTMGDANGIEDIRLFIDGVQADPADIVLTDGTVFGDATVNWRYSFPVDEAGHGDDGDYSIEVFADDTTSGATKTSSTTFSLTVDTSSPELIVTAPVDDEYVDSSSYTIRGQATDNSGAGVSTLEYSLDSSDGTDGTWNAIGLTGLNWNVPGVDFSGGGEGAKTLWVRAGDGINGFSTERIDFFYDTSDPSLTAVVNPALSATNSDFALEGSVSDLNALAASDFLVISASKDGADQGQVYSAPAGGAWSYPVILPGDGSADGMWVYSISATDIAGRTSEATLSVYIDETAPESISFEDPGQYISGNSASLLGTSSDAGSGLATLASGGVEYSLDSTDGIDGTWTSVSGSPANWNIPLDLDIDGPGADTGLSEGSHVVWVRAVDKAGNLAASVSQAFVVDQSAPFLSNLKEEAGADWGQITLYKSLDFTITGTANDTNGVDDVEITQSKDGGPGAALSVTLNGSAGDTARTWSVDTDISAGQGSYQYVITITDSVGRQNSVIKTVVVDTSAPDAPVVTAPIAGQWLSGASFVAAGTATDNGSAGISEVYYQVDVRGATPPADLSDPSWITATGSDSWNGTFALAGEGERSLFVVAVDTAGNESPMTTVDYGIDQNAPLIGIDDGLITRYENGSFVISGTASDSNEISQITVEEKYGAGVYGAPVAATWNPGPGTWSFSRTIGVGDSDGSYSFRFTATDAAGKTVSLEKDLLLDRNAPVIAFGNAVPFIDDFPADPGRIYGNGEMSISGTITEDNGVANLDILEYSLDGGGIWNPLVLGSAFTINAIDTTLTPDGSDLTISVRAIDRNGNADSENYVIRIDQDSDKPVLTISAPTEAETISSQTINVSGNISDDDGVGLNPDSVQYRFSTDGGGTWGAWTDVSTTGSVTDRSFSFSFVSSTDGSKAIQMRGEDNAGTPVVSDTVTVNFLQDTGAPTLSALAPASFSYANGDFTVSGTATDSNGVDSVDIRVLREGSEVIAFTSASLTGSAGDSPRNFSYLVDTSFGEGLYQVILRSQDSGGNTREDSIQIYVDKTPPTLSFTSPAPASTRNNIIGISGTSGDNYSLASLAFRIVDVNSGNIERTLPTGLVSGVSNWNILGFDTRDATLLSYAANLGGGVYELTLRAIVTDQAGNSYTTAGGDDLIFRIDQSADRPDIILDDIAFDGSSSITSTTISGTVTDDDGVDSILVDVYAVDNSITTEIVNLISGSYGDTSIDFSVNLSSNENGLRGIRIRAVDSVDNNGSDYGAGDYSRRDTGEIDFLLDTELPDLAISDPLANLTWSSADSFDFAGTSADETGVVSLEYKFDDSDLDSGTTVIGAPFDNWSFSVAQAALSDGPHTLYVKATDGVGKTRVSSRSFVIDKTAPTINVISPANGDAVFGPLTIGGTTSDNAGGAGVASVSIGLGKQIDPTNAATLEASTWINTGGTTSWSYSFLNINDYANSTFATNTGDLDGDGIEDAGETWTDLWDFIFYIRAEDSAGAAGDGNISYLTSYQLQIDPKRDRPEITILSPADGSTVGGFVRVFGSAFDSQFVEKVQIAIDANNNGDYTDDVWAEGTLDETDAGVNWYQVNGTTSWNINLNEAGEFDPSVGSTRTIGFKVRAKDYKSAPGDGFYGAEEEASVTFNKDFPQFADINLVSGDTVSGTYGLTGLVRDETDIDRIIWSNEGPLLNNTVIFTNPGGLVPPGAANVTGLETAAATALGITVERLGTGDPDYDPAFPGSYRISVPIDTEAAGLYPGGAGSMSVKITAEDSTTPSPFTNQNLISFSVDNIDPSSLSYTGDTDILGTEAEVQGTVRDTGTVAGIDRVVLYIENRSGEIVRLKGGSGSIPGFDPNDVYDLTNGVYDDYRIVIDNTLEGGAPGDDLLPSGDGDGYDERLALSAGTYQWSALFDSTLLTDGAVTVHYRAVDFAGNLAEDSQAAFIANNKPAITSLLLGTDLDGSGSVEPGEQSTNISAGYASSNFTARNNRLYIGVNTIGGNGTLRYSVIYNTVEQNGLLTDGTIEIDTTGFTESVAANDQSLTIRVYDSTTSDDDDATDELSDSLTLNLTVDNVDEVVPSIAVADIGKVYSESQSDAGKVIGDVADYEDNIVMSGNTRLGQVQYGLNSQFDGAAFDIYTAAGGPLSGADWSFEYDGSDYLTEANGNVFNWNFSFNTAAISGITDNDLQLTFKVYDFNPTANGGLGNLGSGSLTVDVVPYISDIQRNPLIYNTDRSKRGVFPVQAGETGVIIHGFNLSDSTVQDADNWIRVYNSALASFQTPAITAASADRDRLTISLAGVDRSGYLRVSTGGISDINMISLNSLEYNKEDDGNGIVDTLWNDDRYLSIWEVGDFFDQSENPEHPSMDIRASNGRIYGAWSNYAASAAYYARPNSQATGRTQIFSTYDPPEWTDMAMEQGANTVHNVILENYYGGTTTTAWGFLATYINNGTRVTLDDMGDDRVANTNHADGFDEQLYQFQNPRIVISNEGTNQRYIAYYDAWAKAVKYSVATGNTETFTTENGNMTNQATVVDGIDDFDDDPSDSGDDVGQYLDIQIDPDDGVPVIVYYDTTNKTLKIARGQNAQPNGSAQWNVDFVLPANSFSGQYVTMKVDDDVASPTYGDLFIAYYKVSTGDLMFIRAADVDGTGAGVQYSFDAPVTVDSEGAVGPWADIFLVDGNPVISYINATQVGTFSGLKVARYTGDGSSWIDAADWEYEIVPAATAVFNKRTNIVGLDAPDVTADNWDIAVGYASATFDLVYRKLEQ